MSVLRGQQLPGSRLISLLPLPPLLIEKLSVAGYHEVGHLAGLEPCDLAEELGMDIAEARLALVNVLSGGEPPSQRAPLRTGLVALAEIRRAPRIITFVRELDALLGGGLQLAQLTEVAGAPGVGKTQLSIQLALNVQIPDAFAGMGSEALFIDTEGSFMAIRAEQMAEALLSHLATRGMDPGYGDDEHVKRRALAELSTEKLLSRIHVFRVMNVTELLATVRQIPTFVRARRESPEGGRVGIVIIDSVAFHFRHTGGGLDYPCRMWMLQQLSQQLREQSEAERFAAVLINQMTTRVNEQTNESIMVPALGATWAHQCNTQLELRWSNGHRVARLTKGAKPGEVTYTVTREGVRSLPMSCGADDTLAKGETSRVLQVSRLKRGFHA